jgi:putative ABC transport system substrate-binding protein
MEMRRREFIGLLAGVAASPSIAHAQMRGMRVIGFLSSWHPSDSAPVIEILRLGLKDAGFIEGHNVSMLFRWAEGRIENLPALAAELVDLKVDTMFVVTNAAALAAKAATSTIPIVFAIGGDPVALGLVASIRKPDGNLTGISAFSNGLDGKRVELLHRFAPQARVIGLLINPADPAAEAQSREARAAAQKFTLQLETGTASSDAELEPAFAALAEAKISALFIPNDAFFNSRAKRLIDLAARYRLPTLYPWREFAELGGLMSFGPNLRNAFYQATVYLRRILRGVKPGNLPVLLPADFELVINGNTAAARGITIPQTLRISAAQIIR